MDYSGLCPIRYHSHAILGLLALLHFAYRYSASMVWSSEHQVWRSVAGWVLVTCHLGFEDSTLFWLSSYLDAASNAWHVAASCIHQYFCQAWIIFPWLLVSGQSFGPCFPTCSLDADAFNDRIAWLDLSSALVFQRYEVHIGSPGSRDGIVCT